MDRVGNLDDGFQLQVTVRATDADGDPHDTTAANRDTYSDTVVVNITLENLAEDPQISDQTIADFAENGTITDALATFTAVTEDTSSASRWSLTGPDAGKFEFANPTVGALTFEEEPDYEKPGDADGDNVYEITVRVADDDGRIGTKDVTVEVTNFDEPGTVSLSPTQHRVGVPITATLKDTDDGVYGVSVAVENRCVNVISGATSDTYTPKVGDINVAC